MRTGSHLNAWFKGDHRKEFGWFSFGATTPLVSINAERAAHKIVDSICAGDAEVILTPQAKLAAAVHGVFPGLTADLMSVINRLLPNATGSDRRERHLGSDSQTRLTRSFLQGFGRRAARKWNQERTG
jgi:hypothetical protein